MGKIVAITRAPALSLSTACELTFIGRSRMSFDTLQRQHATYCAALADAGAEVVLLEAEHTLPDSVFVEDALVVLDELAVTTRPGAASRRPEPALIEESIAHFRTIARIVAPATLEGADVLRIGRRLFVGISTRTDQAGIAQLADIVRPHGYEVVPVHVSGSLHLKTACTALDAETLLLNPAWIDTAAFAGFDTIAVAADEPFAANVLPIGSNVIANLAFPRTLERILAHTGRHGLRTIAVDISEFGKAEGGLTCMSLVFRDQAADGP